MKKWVFGIDIGMTIITAFVLVYSSGGCSSAQLDAFALQLQDQNSTLQQVAEAMIQTVPVVQAVAVTLPAGVWTVLGLNIASSVAAAIVASRKNKVVPINE